MPIKFSIFRGCMRTASDVVDPISPSSSFNLREEYANAFRTESYNEFWARVLDLTFTHGSNGLQPRRTDTSTSTSTAARLPSYRLFTEHLLDPDQATVTNILATASSLNPNIHLLLTDYFSETAAASLLCGRLLRDIENIRRLYRRLKTSINSLASTDDSRSLQEAIDHCIVTLSNTLDSPTSFQAIHDGSDRILTRFKLARKKLKAKVRFITRLKWSLSLIIFILAASASMFGIHLAIHGLCALTFAMPVKYLPCSLSGQRLTRMRKQLDVATKGTYILNRDLDTISRLVERLRDEVEHMVVLLGYCRDDRRRLTQEVVRRIGKNDGSFKQQLDELEEHLYLCFMTINKARSLVMKEVLATTIVS